MGSSRVPRALGLIGQNHPNHDHQAAEERTKEWLSTGSKTQLEPNLDITEELYASLLDALGDLRTTSTQFPAAGFADLQARLFLWGSDFRDGRLSYILSHAVELRDLVLRFLKQAGELVLRIVFPDAATYDQDRFEHLRLLLEQIKEVPETLTEKLDYKEDYHQLDGPRTPIPHGEENGQAEIEPAGECSYDDDDHRSTCSVGTSDEDVYDSLQNEIDCLMDLLPSLEQTYAHLQLTWEYPARRQAKTFSVSPEALPFVQYIADKFDGADNVLIQRLGESNWQRFMTLRARKEQMSQLLDEGNTTGQTGATITDLPASAIFKELSMPKSLFTRQTLFQDSGLGTSIPALPNRAFSEASHTSFLSSLVADDGAALRVPKTPVAVSRGEWFACDICGGLLHRIRNRIDWKRHVFEDLQPYVCTFSSCSMHLTKFATRNQWAEHEFREHRVVHSWRCPECGLIAPTGENLTEHLQQSHPQIVNESQTTLVVASSMQIQTVPIEDQKCPLCQAKPGKSKRNFVKHLARHLESIALAVLPRECEELSEPESNASMNSRQSQISVDSAVVIGEKGESSHDMNHSVPPQSTAKPVPEPLETTWTWDESTKFFQLACLNFDWTYIASRLSGKSPQQCEEHWEYGAVEWSHRQLLYYDDMYCSGSSAGWLPNIAKKIWTDISSGHNTCLIFPSLVAYRILGGPQRVHELLGPRKKLEDLLDPETRKALAASNMRDKETHHDTGSRSDVTAFTKDNPLDEKKRYVCAYCGDRFEDRNEVEQHQSSLHPHRHSWSCATLQNNVEATFYPNNAESPHPPGAIGPFDVCGYCGEEFPNLPQPDWAARLEHSIHVHKFQEQLRLQQLEEAQRHMIDCVCKSDLVGDLIKCRTCDKYQHHVCYYNQDQAVDSNHRCVNCEPRPLQRKEYLWSSSEFLLNIDIEDGHGPYKLAYNNFQIPRLAATKFLHDHGLPMGYLDRVEDFITSKTCGWTKSGQMDSSHSAGQIYTGVDPLSDAQASISVRNDPVPLSQRRPRIDEDHSTETTRLKEDFQLSRDMDLLAMPFGQTREITRELYDASTNTDFREDIPKSGQCPYRTCHGDFEDLKTHLLTHQNDRREKCPINSCIYHIKGFARKFECARHTLSHYRRTMVCDFCPDILPLNQFNRADLFQRHLTSLHGVTQSPTGSRRIASTPAAKSGDRGKGTGKCPACSRGFNNVQDLYDHLFDCIIDKLKKEQLSEHANYEPLMQTNDDLSRDKVERDSQENEPGKHQQKYSQFLQGKEPFVQDIGLRKAKQFACTLEPYGCTSGFSSMQDWKQHVATQHIRLGFWRCTLEGCCSSTLPSGDQDHSGAEPIFMDFPSKDNFVEHLRKVHALQASAVKPVSLDEWLEQEVQRCFIPLRDPPPESVCGYCGSNAAGAIHVSFRGAGAWEKRMDHVGQHMGNEDGHKLYWIKDPHLERWLVEHKLVVGSASKGWRLGDPQVSNMEQGNPSTVDSGSGNKIASSASDPSEKQKLEQLSVNVPLSLMEG